MNSVIPAGLLAQIDPLTLGLRSVVPALGVTVLTLAVIELPSMRGRFGKGKQARDGFDNSDHWAQSLANALGFFACYVGIHGWPPASWYPDMKARLAWAALGAGLFGVIRIRKPAHQLWMTPLFLLTCSAWLLWHWHAKGMWNSTLTWGWIAGTTLVASIQISSLERLARRRPGPGLSLAFALAGALASCSFFLSHSESHARLGAGLATCLGVGSAAAFWRPRRFSPGGSVVVFVTLFDGLALANHLTADLPPVAFALILLSPLGAWVPETPLLRDKNALLRWAVGLSSLSLPLALAAWQAHVANPPYGY